MPVAPAGDIQVHYVEAGQGPPLVLLHGIGGSVEDWENQIAAFAQHYRVIAVDLRGFGRTPAGQRAPSVEQMAQDVDALLRGLQIGRIALLGYSMGGAVALQFALDRPAMVSRLVIANSVPSFRPRTLREHFEKYYRLVVMTILGPARLAAIGARRMFPHAHQQALRERTTARGARNTRPAYMGALRRLTRWSVIDRLDELRMPVLVLAAEHDYFAHEDTVRFAYALNRPRLHVFKGTRHGLPQEAPEAFNRVVLRFLRREER